MNGSGCKNCPVNPCETMTYRGSVCASQRAKLGLGDPKTNADRIRAMTDEELARKFVNTSYRYDWKQDEDYWYFPNGTTKTNYKPKATEAWLEWLKHPAEQKSYKKL